MRGSSTVKTIEECFLFSNPAPIRCKPLLLLHNSIGAQEEQGLGVWTIRRHILESGLWYNCTTEQLYSTYAIIYCIYDIILNTVQKKSGERAKCQGHTLSVITQSLCLCHIVSLRKGDLIGILEDAAQQVVSLTGFFHSGPELHCHRIRPDPRQARQGWL